jgi:hypothetical protein
VQTRERETKRKKERDERKSVLVLQIFNTNIETEEEEIRTNKRDFTKDHKSMLFQIFVSIFPLNLKVQIIKFIFVFILLCYFLDMLKKQLLSFCDCEW